MRNVACILRNSSNTSFSIFLPLSLSPLFFLSLCYPLIYRYPSRKDRLVLTNSNGISLMTYFFAEPACLQTAYSTPRGRPSSVNTSSTNPLTQLPHPSPPNARLHPLEDCPLAVQQPLIFSAVEK